MAGRSDLTLARLVFEPPSTMEPGVRRHAGHVLLVVPAVELLLPIAGVVRTDDRPEFAAIGVVLVGCSNAEECPLPLLDATFPGKPAVAGGGACVECSFEARNRIQFVDGRELLVDVAELVLMLHLGGSPAVTDARLSHELRHVNPVVPTVELRFVTIVVDETDPDDGPELRHPHRGDCNRFGSKSRR